MIAKPEQIEAELARIQRQSSPTEARTTILNLVVFSTEGTRQEVERALDSILGKRAARVIHITESDSEESDLHVSARCYLDQEQQSVCFQEVLVTNGADNLGQAPGSWSPLLIRDLPTYILWLRPISTQIHLLRQALEHGDKLLIDSETNLQSGETPKQLYEALSEQIHTQDIVLSDLTWRRSEELRRLTALAFDTEATSEALFSIDSVSMRGGTRMFDMLYLAWLAARLSWRKQDDALVDREGRSVSLELHRGASLQEGITIHFGFRNREEVVLYAMQNGCAELEGVDHFTECPVFTVPDTGDLLLDEIDRVHNEWLYMEAIETLVRKLSRIPDLDKDTQKP